MKKFILVCILMMLCAIHSQAQSFSWEHPLPNGNPIYDISCVGSGFCMAVGDSNTILQWDGTVWQSSQLPQYAELYSLTSVSCTSASFCIAVGSKKALIWNGVSWAFISELDNKDLMSVSCVDSEFCITVGVNETRIWNGISWTPNPLSGFLRANTISCVSQTFCVAINNVGIHHWNGTQWIATLNFTSLSTPFLARAVSCVNENFCVTVSHESEVLEWNGATWTKNPTATGSFLSPNDLSCSAIDFCKATNTWSEMTWNGITWTYESNSELYGYTVFCVSDTLCFSGSQTSALQQWNGLSWSAIPYNINALNAIDCVGNFCVAVGQLGTILHRNSGTWTTITSNTTSVLWDVDCATSSFCVAVGNDGVLLQWNGSTWNSINWGGTSPINAISCPQANFCMAISTSTIIFWNGNSWVVSNDSGNPYLNDISCSSNTFCMGTLNSSANVTYAWNGSRWLDQPLRDYVTSKDIRCIGNSCMLVNNTGSLYKWDGTVWKFMISTPFIVTNRTGLRCLTPYYCYIIQSPQIWTWNGATVTSVVTPTLNSLRSLSVVSSSTSELPQKTGQTAPTLIVVGDNGTVLSSTSTALPIVWGKTSFKTENNTATINWSTLQETNSDRYKIQQQTKGNWKTVGEVQSKGNTSNETNYSFTIPNLDYGKHLFRIAQIDFDGSVSYSEQIQVFIELAQIFALSEPYPNPFNPTTNLSLAVASPQNVKIDLYDLTGRHIQTIDQNRLEAQTSHYFTINLSQLPSGKYLLYVEGETFKTQKLLTLMK